MYELPLFVVVRARFTGLSTSFMDHDLNDFIERVTVCCFVFQCYLGSTDEKLNDEKPNGIYEAYIHPGRSIDYLELF